MNVVILTLINKRTTNMLKEVSYKDLKFNPFRLIGDEWMLVVKSEQSHPLGDGKKPFTGGQK